MKNQLESYFDRLFPLNRSLTGSGVRDTFAILQELVPFTLTEVPSGTRVLDWTVPQEWEVTEAYILTPDGRRIADFNDHNLHLVGYSIPFEGTLTYAELVPHLHTRPDSPEVIPYVTSYYTPRWGFCLPHSLLETLPQEGLYEVVVRTRLFDGSMTVGEAVLPGTSEQEVLFTSYCCHPSMANNELSGILALAFLYRQIQALPERKYTYRFYLAPETIGAIYYLSERGTALTQRLLGGAVLTCCGDAGLITFKHSRTPGYFDRRVAEVLAQRGTGFKEQAYFPMGSDERQYGSPGYNLPMVCLSRTQYGQYPEYHTSADAKGLMDFEALADFIHVLFEVVQTVETDVFYRNLKPYGEPQLGTRGLYPTLMDTTQRSASLKRLLYLLNYSDGTHSLRDISALTSFPVAAFATELAQLEMHALLEKTDYVFPS